LRCILDFIIFIFIFFLGKVASVNKSPYVASKHGVIGLTKVVALENATTGKIKNQIALLF